MRVSPLALCQHRLCEQSSPSLSFPAPSAEPPPSSWLCCFQREAQTARASLHFAALSNLTKEERKTPLLMMHLWPRLIQFLTEPAALVGRY